VKNRLSLGFACRENALDQSSATSLGLVALRPWGALALAVVGVLGVVGVAALLAVASQVEEQSVVDI
jgi:hypothetical protein